MGHQLLAGASRPRGRAGLWLLVPVLVALALLYAWLVKEYAARFGGNLSALACVGDRFPAPDIHGPGTYVFKDSFGYDGQFYLMAAHDPLVLGRAARYMDVPAYRYQRIMYPWLAWLAALGRRERIPTALVAVNLAAVLAGALILGLYARRHGMSPLWALAYGLSSGLLLAVLRDLAEPVAVAFMLAGLYAYERRRHGWGALWLACALLTKEYTALVVAALLVHTVLTRGGWRRFLSLWAACLPLALWVGYLYLRLGVLPLAGGSANFGRPLAGMYQYALRVLAMDPGPEQFYGGLFLLVTAAAMLLALWETIRSFSGVALSFLAFAVFFAFLSHKVWVEPWSYGRVMLPLGALMLMAWLSRGDRLYFLPVLGQVAGFGLALWWLGFLPP